MNSVSVGKGSICVRSTAMRPNNNVVGGTSDAVYANPIGRVGRVSINGSFACCQSKNSGFKDRLSELWIIFDGACVQGNDDRRAKRLEN